METSLFDKNGNPIMENSNLIYQEGTYVVLNNSKDGYDWMAHPSGSTPGPDYDLDDICGECEVME